MYREVLNLKYSFPVLSRTDRAGHHQSVDAIIEEISKKRKRDLVDVRNETQWKRAFQNLLMINQVRSSNLEVLESSTLKFHQMTLKVTLKQMFN